MGKVVQAQTAGTSDDATRKRPRTAPAEEERSKRGGGSGGIYIPPHRATTDGAGGDESGGDGYQCRNWDALRKSITGLVNKATPTNIRHVAPELLAENLMRVRGLLCRTLLRSQAACPAFTAIFVRAHAAGERHVLAAAARFVAPLLLALELLALLLNRPTDGAVEVAVGFVTECGAALHESCPRGLDAVFGSLRSILHDGDIEKRTQFMIEDLFAVRKSQFRGHPPVRPELDLVEHHDQVTHQIELSLDEDKLDPEDHLDVFTPSPTFAQDEVAYQELKRAMLGDDENEDEKTQQSSTDDDEESSDHESDEEATIHDGTDTDLTTLRRTIYLKVMSSADSDEAGHKLLSVVRPGQEAELCAMLVECSRKEKAYTSYYGRIGRRLCAMGRAYQGGFEACLAGHYSAAHRMTSDELRATARFFADLLAADAVPWRGALGRVRVTEEDTTSSLRIFIKVLFQDLGEQLGIRKLSEKVNDEDTEVRDALFPRDCARNTRFAINFFTVIGLGGVTESARKLVA
ncbi:hypothetical protein SETIT_7G030500v2 [Setaria italica]|uniref:MI domain-containing protein n=1 Tax=Setaria italica TaxID=4555 RepID=A0A368RRI5_SETIT|nr:hypothetical protein SETIT_7G030500v2 [Setaria italica]